MVPALANINTSMLSMALETLFEIMLKAVLYKEQTTLAIGDVRKIYQHLENNNADAAKQAIQQKREVSIKNMGGCVCSIFCGNARLQKSN